MRLKMVRSESWRAFACLQDLLARMVGAFRRSLRHGSPLQFFARFPAECLNVFAGPPRAHGPHIVRSKLGVVGADGGAISGHDQWAAALSTGQARADRGGLVDLVLVVLVVNG